MDDLEIKLLLQKVRVYLLDKKANEMADKFIARYIKSRKEKVKDGRGRI